ncbi:MAG TPA: hypothetical protein VGR24_06320 [bacterium]|nr:hypothetical protein [bacterium]
MWRAVPLLARRGIHDPEVHPRWRSIWALTSVDDGSVPALKSPSDVDVVELAELDLVDADDAAGDLELFLKKRSQEAGNVGIDDKQERAAFPGTRNRSTIPTHSSRKEL